MLWYKNRAWFRIKTCLEGAKNLCKIRDWIVQYYHSNLVLWKGKLALDRIYPGQFTTGQSTSLSKNKLRNIKKEDLKVY